MHTGGFQRETRIHVCLGSVLIIFFYFCSGSGCPWPCSCPSVELIKSNLNTVTYTGRRWLGSTWRKGCASWLKCLWSQNKTDNESPSRGKKSVSFSTEKTILFCYHLQNRMQKNTGRFHPGLLAESDLKWEYMSTAWIYNRLVSFQSKWNNEHSWLSSEFHKYHNKPYNFH